MYENASFPTALPAQYVVFFCVFANLKNKNGILEWFWFAVFYYE